MTKRQPDANYPFGYGKFEQLGSLGVSGLIVLTALGIGKESVEAILFPGSWDGDPAMVPYSLAACAVSVGIKEALYWKTLQVGKETQSGVLVANAWHHRSDAWSSLVAGLGIAGSSVGWHFLDPAAGCVVALGIFKIGAQMGYDSLLVLADRQCGDLRKQVYAVVKQSDVEVANIRVRKSGAKAFVHLGAVVSARQSISAAEHAASKLRTSVMENVPDVKEVLIEWRFSESTAPEGPSVTENEVRQIVMQAPNVLLCPHIRCHFLPQGVAIEVGIISKLRTVSDLKELTESLRERILKAMSRDGCVRTCDCVDVVEVDVKLVLGDGCSFIGQNVSASADAQPQPLRACKM